MLKTRLVTQIKLKTASIFAGCFVCFLSFITLVQAAPQSEQQQEAKAQLQRIQKEIQSQNKQIMSGQSELNKIEQLIQKTDLSISDVAKSLQHTQTDLRHVKLQLNKLTIKKQQLEHEKQQQLNALGEQIRSAYQVGDHDYLMMLLNQESPAKLERAIVYYQYFNEARIELIKQFKVTLTELAKIEHELTNKTTQLNALLARQIEQESDLQTLKNQQNLTHEKLDQQLSNAQGKLKRLKESEHSLTELIEQLAKTVEQLPDLTDLKGLKNYQGKLPWPTTGKVQKIFGKRKRGPLRWKGIIIDGQLGRSVKNIHAGQVIFADWMKSYGLVMVIDHGQGYMSLYGHNQTLLKDVGDIVEAGETIALVGQSGGQSAPNLYFEIRHQGQPMNPSKWCK